MLDKYYTSFDEMIEGMKPSDEACRLFLATRGVFTSAEGAKEAMRQSLPSPKDSLTLAKCMRDEELLRDPEQALSYFVAAAEREIPWGEEPPDMLFIVNDYNITKLEYLCPNPRKEGTLLYTYPSGSIREIPYKCTNPNAGYYRSEREAWRSVIKSTDHKSSYACRKLEELNETTD